MIIIFYPSGPAFGSASRLFFFSFLFCISLLFFFFEYDWQISTRISERISIFLLNYLTKKKTVLNAKPDPNVINSKISDSSGISNLFEDLIKGKLNCRVLNIFIQGVRCVEYNSRLKKWFKYSIYRKALNMKSTFDNTVKLSWAPCFILDSYPNYLDSDNVTIWSLASEM